MPDPLKKVVLKRIDNRWEISFDGREPLTPTEFEACATLAKAGAAKQTETWKRDELLWLAEELMKSAREARQ